MSALQWLAIALGLLVVTLSGFSAWLWFERLKKPNRSVGRLPNTLSDRKVVKELQGASKVYLTYGDADSPLAELESFTLRKGEKLIDLPQTNGLPLFLGPLLQRLPELFNKGSEALGLVYRCKFSPAVTRGLLSGTSKLLRTTSGTFKATAVSATGSRLIQGGADVISTAGNPAAIVIILWQVAAIVTAQKYLADIDRRLNKLESQLGQLLGLIQDQMFAKLKAYVFQLEVKFSSIKRGALLESDFASLGSFFDDVEHECISVLETAKSQVLQSRKRALVAASNKDKPAFLNECETIETYSHLWSAATYTRLVAKQVNALLPIDQKSVSDAAADMSTRLKEFSSERHKFLRDWRQKKETDGKLERLPIFRSKHHPDVVKSLLRGNKLTKLRESHLSELCSVTDKMLTAQAQRLAEPLEIKISLDGGGGINSVELIERPRKGETFTLRVDEGEANASNVSLGDRPAQ